MDESQTISILSQKPIDLSQTISTSAQKSIDLIQTVSASQTIKNASN